MLEPSSIRARLQSLQDSERRARALSLTDELTRLREEYRSTVESALETYLEVSGRQGARADDHIASLEVNDAAFGRVLAELVRLRDAMVETLDEEEWAAVFGP